MKKKRSVLSKTALLFGAAALLLALSTVGSTRAALNYRSQNFGMEVSVSNIGVSLEENGKTVSSRYYDGKEVREQEALLLNLKEITSGGQIVEAEKLMPGKNYQEELKVTNKGQIDCYVRVTVSRSWSGVDDNGNEIKDTGLAPELIRLNMDDGQAHNGWIVDNSVSGLGKSDSYREQLVLYYTRPLAPGASTESFNETMGIDYRIARELAQETGYENCQAKLEVEVDAVQTHNGADAVKSAWGVDVDIAADGSLSLR